MNTPTWHLSTSGAEQAWALAQAIVCDLQRALHERGAAHLAVSGGRSPALLLETLSRSPLPWSRITISLVDERCVPPTSPDSNEALIRRHLLHRAAAQAHFSPPRPGPVSAAPDVIVLGMGADGHTASLFPDDPVLDAALNPNRPPAYLAVAPAASVWRRLTLNLSAIVQSGHIYVAIEGATKRRVLEQALAGAPELPIRAVLMAAPHSRLYWCPEPNPEPLSMHAAKTSGTDQPH
ncbi:6-phosphogluconolactonase [Castellaniella caeni]|uniref:6-phosphogluconolactonase n=1 Tax=Castellaniella caeni TaxID=266123 RepID=UPI000C9EDB7D|nr:6-phosphogluconolactonase [Castellaniella caeni]